jgi:putative membrane protein
VQAGYWRWAHPSPGLPGIDTVPLTNLAGWLLAGLLLMPLLDRLVHRTARPARGPLADAAPLLVLGWMTLGGAVAHAGWLDLPGSAVWGAVLALPVLAGVARTLRARGAEPR